MQLGCGLVVREIKGRQYLYFWSYEPRSWGSRRVWTYVGPVRRGETRVRARSILLEYHHWIQREVARKIQALERV